MKTSPWPADGEVHLYCLALPQHPAELARLGTFLTSNETNRAALLKSEQVMRRSIAGRGLLREILGGYLGIEAANVQLTTGEHGKPSLVDTMDRLHFNLSHSGDYFLLAVAANREVGIDIEIVAPGKPLRDMARMVLSSHEQDQLSHLSSPQLEESFCRCWVRKEACLKACGRGFSLPGNSFDISLLNENTAVMVANCHHRWWHVLDMDVPFRYCAALAVESRCPAQPPPIVAWVDHRRST